MSWISARQRARSASKSWRSPVMNALLVGAFFVHGSFSTAKRITAVGIGMRSGDGCTRPSAVPRA
jgi:hypothetical protein